jgi:hypothetical protein
MHSLINVECPHCKARGQIMIPPVGSIIIGPCPKCEDLVVIFCGQVLALDKVLMNEEKIETRREHLLSVLNTFLEDRISNLMSEDFNINTRSLSEVVDDTELEESEVEFVEEEASVDFTALSDAEQSQSITQSEVDRFTDVDLKLLDNKAYFKSVFGA